MFKMSSNSDPCDFLGPYTKEQNISVADILKSGHVQTLISFNNGIVYEIRKYSSSDVVAAETINKLGKGNT